MLGYNKNVIDLVSLLDWWTFLVFRILFGFNTTLKMNYHINKLNQNWKGFLFISDDLFVHEWWKSRKLWRITLRTKWSYRMMRFKQPKRVKIYNVSIPIFQFFSINSPILKISKFPFNFTQILFSNTWKLEYSSLNHFHRIPLTLLSIPFSQIKINWQIPKSMINN